jgi:hypothetical protein
MMGSIVLAADDPAALAHFYGALLDVEPQLGLSSTHWRGRLALCLQRQADGTGPLLALFNAWITTALDLGASVPGPPHQEPFGAEAWLLEPEDNRMLLLMLPFGSSKADETPPAADPSV